MMRLTGVVQQLLILNIIFFVAKMVLDAGVIPGIDGNFLALHYPTSEQFRPLQIVTHFFMHGNFMHIFFNMFALVMFGPPLEIKWGPQRFLIYYMVCALGAAALHMGVTHWEISNVEGALEAFRAMPSAETLQTALDAFADYVPYYDWEAYREGTASILQQGGAENISENLLEALETKKNIPIVGASGAIFGLLLAFGMFFPNTELMLIFLPIPIKAKYFIPLMMIAELFLGVQRFSWDNIAHFAHLGGAVTGFLLILYWRRFGRHPNQIN